MAIVASDTPYVQEIKFWADQVLTTVATKSASGDQEVIAAPTNGQRLVLLRIFAQRTAASTAETTLIFKDTSGNIAKCVLNEYVPGVILFDAQSIMQLRALARNSPLTLNLSAANSVEVTVRYIVVE